MCGCVCGGEGLSVWVCVWRGCAFIVSYNLFVISCGRMFRDCHGACVHSMRPSVL